MLTAVASALRTVRSAEATLRQAVDQARAAGHTWQEIGDLLGTSRQAAFQRFGRPIDPRTGQPMTEPTFPGAARRAEDLAVAVIEGRWEDVRRDFDERMLEAVSLAMLGVAWAQVAGSVGRYERMGEPFMRPLGDYTVVDVPLFFEAGERILQVTYRADGLVAGLFVKPLDQV